MNETKNPLDRRRYLILLFACLINLCIGSMYAWSSLSAPMAAELGVDSLSSVFSVANAVSFLAMIVGGILNDRFGPRWVMFSGGVMFGVGMFTCAFAQSVWHLTLSYGILLGLGMSLVYGCTISNTIKFFPDRRGMVGGMTTASYGISSVIFAPVGSALCAAYGPRATFMILGAVFFAVVCAGAFVMQKAPAGYLPQGFVPVLSKAAGRDHTPLEMLKTPVFYVMLLLLTCGGTFGLMVISGAQPLALRLAGVNAPTATLFVSVLCLFNTAGRLVAGSLSDRFGRVGTLVFALVMALVGLGALWAVPLAESASLFAVGLMLIGVCFGTFMGVFPGFCTDRFGTKNNTVNYGIMWIGFSAAGIVGPTILSSSYQKTASYQSAFLIAFGIAVLGILMVALYTLLEKKRKGD